MQLPVAKEQRAKVESFQRRHRIAVLTLLFTDIVGSTKLKQDLGDRQAVNPIQQHHAVVRELLGRFSEALEIVTAGDSFFIVFAKPSDAVTFSLLLQALLRSLAQESGVAIPDRIGIHVGEVFVEEREGSRKPIDLYGIQVDSSARVMSLAQGDQILMTRFAFDNAQQILKGEAIQGIGPLSWLNHGPYLMKGVEEPLEICEVGEIGQSPLSPPANSEKAHRHISADAEPVLGWRPSGKAISHADVKSSAMPKLETSQNESAFEYRSEWELFGVSLVHIAFGLPLTNGRKPSARGYIAIGDSPRGLIAIGSFAIGVIALGAFPLGLVSFGFLAIGGFSVGAIAIGLIGSYGVFTIAPVAFGWLAIGYYGGGENVLASHASPRVGPSDPTAKNFFEFWLKRWVHVFLLSLCFLSYLLPRFARLLGRMVHSAKIRSP